MPIMSDMEIIKSAIIYGDLDDAVSVVKGRQRALSYALKRKPSIKNTEYSEFLQNLENLLQGQITLSQFREKTVVLSAFLDYLDITGDRENLFSSFFYLLEYSLDRYNVRYPQFDAKRCDDK